MNEFQPGMLALVIGCTKDAIDVGKIVTLERFLLEGDTTPDGGWAMSDLWLATGNNLHRFKEGSTVCGDYGLYRSKNLLPIRPLSDPLHEKQQQELHA